MDWVINTHRTQSQEKDKNNSAWLEWDIDTSHTGRNSTQNTRSTASDPPQTGHHTALPTIGRWSHLDENTVVTACVIVTDAVPRRGSIACCRAGLTAVVRYKPYSCLAIGSTCAVYQDDVPSRASRHRLLQAAKPKRKQLPLALAKTIPSTKIHAHTP